jgi:predicted nucleic acid-binding protein
MEGIEQILLKEFEGAIVGIDSMIFIYHIEGNKKYLPLTKHLLYLVEQNKFKGATSILTLIELLIKPNREGRDDLIRDYKFLLKNFPNLILRSLDEEVAESTAETRARYNLRTPDAIQVATAMVVKAKSFVTNDRRFEKVDALKILILDDLF